MRAGDQAYCIACGCRWRCETTISCRARMEARGAVCGVWVPVFRSHRDKIRHLPRGGATCVPRRELHAHEAVHHRWLSSTSTTPVVVPCPPLKQSGHPLCLMGFLVRYSTSSRARVQCPYSCADKADHLRWTMVCGISHRAMPAAQAKWIPALLAGILGTTLARC